MEGREGVGPEIIDQGTEIARSCMENAIIQQAIEENVLAAAKHVESHLDDQLQALENLNSDDVEQLRQKRLLQLKLYARKKQGWLDKGHGEYSEVLSEKDFFSQIKGKERLVCHFYRENWPCKVRMKRKLVRVRL